MWFWSQPDLADFYVRLVDAVGGFSFELSPSGELRPPEGMPVPHASPEAFKNFAFSRMKRFLKLEEQFALDRPIEVRPLIHLTLSTHFSKKGVTLVMPTIEMGILGIHHDSTVVQSLLREATSATSLRLTSPYFNLHEDTANAILHTPFADSELIVAAPKANGFYNSPGLSKWIPLLYRKGALHSLYSLSCGLSS